MIKPENIRKTMNEWWAYERKKKIVTSIWTIPHNTFTNITDN